VRPGPRQVCPDAFGNPRPLELGDRAEHVQLEPAGRRRRVDPFGKADECHAHGVQLVEQQNQVLEGSDLAGPVASTPVRQTAAAWHP